MDPILESYPETVEQLEEVEQNIDSYQEFLGSVQVSFDECRNGCRDRFNGGRVLDAEYIRSSHHELTETDQHIQAILQGEEVTSTDMRELTDYCRGRIAEMRERRQELKEDRRKLEKTIGFYRHPKKSLGL